MLTPAPIRAPGAITARGSTSTVAVARSAVSLILDVRRHQQAELPAALLQNRGRPFCTSASPLPRAHLRRWLSHAICKNWRARKSLPLQSAADLLEPQGGENARHLPRQSRAI